MLPLTLEITDQNGIQHRPAFRNLRFAKTFYGGEDLWMGFVLDRAGDLDHPDVAYGNDVVLRKGLRPIFVGEMRQIDSDLETVTPKVLGNWILLDDYSYGGTRRDWAALGTATVIHVAEDIVDQIQAGTPISADKEKAQELIRVRDAFTDPNNTSLHLHVPDIDKQRSGWTEDNGDWDIQTNQANVVAVAGVGAVATIDAGVSDGLARVDMLYTTSPSSYGLIFRYQDLNNFWALIAYSTGFLRLWRVDGGVGTFPWSQAGAVVAGPTYELMVRLRGPIIEVFLDGVRLHIETDALHETQTRFGMVSGYATCRFDDFEVCQAPPFWPLVFEDGQTCFRALEYTASFGDELNKVIGWGVESGGNRIFVRKPDTSRVRYIIPPHHASILSARGETDKGFATEAWGKYTQAGTDYWTDKYYAHVTPTGIIANKISTGDDLASNVYGVLRSAVIDFGVVPLSMAEEYLRQYLIEHAHPRVKFSSEVFGPVQDRFKGGAWIQPYEMEMGYIVQIPYFRAVEVKGVAGSDIRWGVGGQWDTTFLLVAMQYDAEKGRAKLIPEGASEDLERMLKFVKEFGRQQEKEALQK